MTSEGGVGVLVEVIGSDVGQAVDQQQNKASHRRQTLLSQQTVCFQLSGGENTQTWVCQPPEIFPLPLFV